MIGTLLRIAIARIFHRDAVEPGIKRRSRILVGGDGARRHGDAVTGEKREGAELGAEPVAGIARQVWIELQAEGAVGGIDPVDPVVTAGCPPPHPGHGLPELSFRPSGRLGGKGIKWR